MIHLRWLTFLKMLCFVIGVSILQTCKINGNHQRFSTANMHHFTTGTPCVQFTFIFQVAFCQKALYCRIVVCCICILIKESCAFVYQCTCLIKPRFYVLILCIDFMYWCDKPCMLDFMYWSNKLCMILCIDLISLECFAHAWMWDV